MEKAEFKLLDSNVNKLEYHSGLMFLSNDRKAYPLSSIPLLPALPVNCRNSDREINLVFIPSYLFNLSK